MIERLTPPKTAAEYRAWWEATAPVPYGRCWCGCGKPAHLAKQSVTKYGQVKGEPVRFLPTHHLKTGKRKPRKLDTQAQSEICRRYQAGDTPQEISAAVGINKTTVYRVLKRLGVAPDRRLSATDTAEACRRYLAGETTYTIASAFGVSAAGIGKALERAGVERRSGREAHAVRWPLTDVQELEACSRYRGGETSGAIALSLDVSASTVLAALDRHGVPRNDRRMYDSAKRHELRALSPQQEAEACRRYRDGESVPALARALGVGVGAIDGALERNGVKKRSGVAGERTAPEIEAEVSRRYLKGEVPKRISLETGVPRATVSFVLKRNGIEPRHKIRYTPQQEAEALRRYLTGERVYEIAADLGISPAGIYPILKRRGLDTGRVARRLEWEETQAAKVIRGLPAYRKWRLAVLARDGRACQDCKAHSTFDNPLHVHHLQSFASILAEHRPINVDEAERYRPLWNTGNGITLCAGCHRKAHAARADRFGGLT